MEERKKMSKYIMMVALVGLVGCAEDGTSCFAETDGSCVQVFCTDGSLETVCSGEDGTDGVDGTNGTNGTNGTDGVDGTNGTPGVDGAPGVDGQDGSLHIVFEAQRYGGPPPYCVFVRPINTADIVLVQAFVCADMCEELTSLPEVGEYFVVPTGTLTCIGVWGMKEYTPCNSPDDCAPGESCGYSGNPGYNHCGG